MSKNADDFMIEEYKQIAQAFFALHTQRNQLLRYYLTLMTIGTTVVSIGSQALPTILPQIQPVLTKELLGVLMAFFALLGIVIFTSIIGVRHDMLMYARTVNEIRGYFSKKDITIQPHLVLPTSCSKPPFWETPLRYFFWEVTLVSIVNSSLIAFAMILVNLLQISSFSLIGITQIVPYIIIFTAIHHVWYFLLSYLREKEFKQPKLSATPTKKGQK